ncbi:MAG: hypothetical protein CME82_06225 [Halomonas sp.]|nr:hypothetical protein [Halomonas sp.]|tara:strand:+ start:3529 stop:3807 length:279 start_codon:yes stop_codon:yes gene_type:complete
MPKFVVRVELRRASSENYEELHEKMQRRGFNREIVGQDGKRYRLPDAEYVTEKDGSAYGIREEVRAIADSVVETNFVLVTQAGEMSWFLDQT